MKRFLSFFVMLVLTLGVMAQTQHMKFMGIPLNGTISAFHQKLVAKGCKPDVEYNKTAPVGSRHFIGTFFGEKAFIIVYYNAKTKVVYRAKAVIDRSSENKIIQKYNEVKSALEEKYPNAYMSKGEQDGKESVGLYTDSGWIDLYVSKYDGYSETPYSLHIDYYDVANYKKNEKSKMNDL
ncbi:MAG: hypothetical protein IIW46_00825 [Bacteroidaceae bacterium]|nr:hypothetical protein [Bacteroidaceae bacterium]